MKINRILLTALVAISASLSAVAQLSMSPYSRYGYGLLNDNATSSQRAMGGVGYAMHSGRQINVMNPASYAHCDSLTFLFDMGIDITTLWSKENGNSGKDFGGGLDYITMQFPVSKTVGMSLGLLPYSSVGYAFGSEIEHGASERSGNGGLNQLYLGAGWMPLKGLSVGANVSYLFGTTINDLYANTDAGSSTLFERVLQVRDFHLQFGAQYTFPISKRHQLTAALTYSPGKTLLGHTYGVYYDVNSDTKPDTVGYTSLKGLYSLPDTWGAGISYEWNNRLLAEIDFTYQPWSNAKYAQLENFEHTHLADRYKIAAGAQWTPDPRGSYLRRVQYRIGGYFNRDYLVIHDNNVHEYGLSAGFGLPAPGRKTMINIGFEYKHRQAHPSPLLKEDYMCVTIGVNFNETWFWRNKIR